MTSIEALTAPVEPGLTPLFTLTVSVDPLQVAGGPIGAIKRIGPISSGTFEGDRLRGRILPGGSDWQTLDADGTVHLDARTALETSEGALVAMTYTGLRHGSANVMQRLAQGELVDPSAYDFRIVATFTTGNQDLAWLNKILAVGTGRRLPAGPASSVYANG
jgi:hypothetical protein